MEMVIVLFCSCQLLLQLNLSRSQRILFVLGFIPLVQHMNQHALTVAVSNCQPLNLQSFLIPFVCYLLQTLLSHTPLSSHPGQSALSLSASVGSGRGSRGANW